MREKEVLCRIHIVAGNYLKLSSMLLQQFNSALLHERRCVQYSDVTSVGVLRRLFAALVVSQTVSITLLDRARAS